MSLFYIQLEKRSIPIDFLNPWTRITHGVSNSGTSNSIETAPAIGGDTKISFLWRLQQDGESDSRKLEFRVVHTGNCAVRAVYGADLLQLLM
jgi:hypothetical protein